MPALSLLGGPTLQILAPAFPGSGPGLHKGRDAGAFALGGPTLQIMASASPKGWNRVCIDSLYPVSRCGVPEDSAPLGRGPAGWGPSPVIGTLTPGVETEAVTATVTARLYTGISGTFG